jgi:hypothetical protein
MAMKQWKRSTSVLLLTGLFWLSSEAGAQDPAPAPTGSDPSVVFEEAYLERLAELSAESAKRQLASVAPADGIPGTAGGTRDLLSTFIAGLGFDGLSSEGEAISLTFNPDFAGELHAVVTFEEPGAYKPILETYAESERADRRTVIEEGLNNFDQTTIKLSWSPQTSRIGRKPSNHQPLFTELVAALDELNVNKQAEDASDAAVQRWAQTGDIGALVAAGRLAADAVDGLERQLTATDLKLLADLIGNQPQLHLDVTRVLRDDLAGPSGWSAALTYEIGFFNLNRLERQRGDSKLGEYASRALKRGTKEAQAFRAGLERRYRLTLKGEYNRDDKLEGVVLPGNAGLFSRSSRDKGSYSLTVGSAVFAGDKKLSKALPRFDLELKFEDPEAADQDDRWLGTLTYSQKVSANSRLALTAVWASDPEFRGEVDQEWSARAGLRFTIDTEEEKKAN